MNILVKLLEIFLTMLPLILTGVVNAIFCKSKLFKCIQIPIDGGKILKDGQRILGDNKTWKGFIATIVISIIMTVVLGLFSLKYEAYGRYVLFYKYYNNTLSYNIILGFLMGLSYAVCELPNSFLKRRLNIGSGGRKSGLVGILFAIIDQIDSIIGVVFVISFVYPMTFFWYLIFIITSGLGHFSLNSMLYLCNLRKKIL